MAQGKGRVTAKTTVAGVAYRVGGVSRTYSPSGSLLDAHMVEAVERDLPESGLGVTLDHDRGNVVGEVTYAELDLDERLAVVAVIDGEWLRSVDQPVYYSGEFDCRGPSSSLLAGKCWTARTAFLIGISLTLSPACFEAQELDVLPGDIRSAADRGSWPDRLGWRARLLERAVANTSRGETRARTIQNLKPSPEQQEAAYSARALEEHFRQNPHLIDRRPGALEHSRHVGKVLRVS
jgi:hypothetical protein